MYKNLDIGNYIETVKDNESFFMDYYFHSIIDLNPMKLDYMLKYGILSKRRIEEKNIFVSYSHSGDSYASKNGNDYVSLVDYELLKKKNKKVYFNWVFESFAFHTMTSLSIMIDKNIEITSEGVNKTNFDDEVFTYDYIDKSHIKGIILPEHLTESSLRDIPFLPNNTGCYLKGGILYLLDSMEKYFNRKISDETKTILIDNLEQAWDIYENMSSDIFASIRKQNEIYGIDFRDLFSEVMNYLWEEKLQKENPTYIDVIKSINNDMYPIYEIKQKTLKKIN